MKPDKFRELYSRIDTDISMDHRIKNRLLYYDNTKETEDRNGYGESYDRSSHTALSKFRKLKLILPSLGVLIFVAIILIGFRANLFSKAPEHETAASSGQSPDESGLSSLLDRLLGDAEGNSEPGITDKSQGKVSEDPAIIEDSNNTEEDLNEKSLPKSISEVTPDDTTKGTEVKPVNPSEISPDSNQTDVPVTDTKTEKAVPVAGDFYFAHFDVLTKGSVKASIPSLVIRLYGNVDSIDPADLSDIVLTRNDVPVDNSITANYRKVQFTWGYEEVTDFYFDFVTTNTEPGVYNLTGKYKGVPFDVYNKILEAAVTEEPADGEDLTSVGWAFKPDKNDKPMIISELVFYFEGLQNSFYVTDLTDLKVTLNGKEIPFSLEERVFRYYELSLDNVGETSFNLILENKLSDSGVYSLTGVYRGKSFTSMDITIP